MKFLRELVSDNNDINEKSVLGFISFFAIIIFAVIDIVLSALGKPVLIPEIIFESFLWLTLGAFGISSVDKYTNKVKNNQDYFVEDQRIVDR